MDLTFIPSPDVAVVLNALLDKHENRLKRSSPPVPATVPPAARSIKIGLLDLALPAYFSQTDPAPRLLANAQLQTLAHAGLLRLAWVPGETGHLLDSVALPPEPGAQLLLDTAAAAACHARLYALLQRTPLAAARARLETLLRADNFRFPAEDWRAQALRQVLARLHAGKSPAPFNLTDAGWNLDLLAVLAALPTLAAETPYRVFSVQVFNDSKRFDELKPALVRLARRAQPAWKALAAEGILQELNLVANPGYIPLSGSWQFTTIEGEILSLGGFNPSVGFPASQAGSIQAVAVPAGAVLCIENLTSFHAFSLAHNQACSAGSAAAGLLPAEFGPGFRFAAICILGNPSPAIRGLLRLVPTAVPIYLWSDLDYGGFNILAQLRQHVDPRIQPFRMDIPTFDASAHLARPLTQADRRNLKRLCSHPGLQNVRPVIEHLIRRGLKLEQEAIQV